MISPKHNSVFKKITKKAVYFLVLFNLLFSLVSPALVVPIPVVLSDFKISRAQIKELVFKLLLADEAKAQAIADIGRWASEGKPQFTIAARFSLDQVVAAHQTVERGEKIGHVLLAPL